MPHPAQLPRRMVLGGAAAAAAATAIPRGATAATLADIKARGSMTVATEDDYQPFEFTKDGKPTGYDVELLDLMRATVPFKVQQDIMPWTGILPGVSPANTTRPSPPS